MGQENRVSGGEISGDSPVEAAWHLLERVVEEEEKGSTALHRAALQRLVSLACTPPPWLLASYKKKDAAELIRVFHSLGHIEVAGEAAIELVKAVMGIGSEYFGLASLDCPRQAAPGIGRPRDHTRGGQGE